MTTTTPSSAPASSSGASAHRVRPLAEGELEAFLAIDAHAFHQAWPISDDERDAATAALETDRCIVAEGLSPQDGIGGIVGIAAAYSFFMSVPGGETPVAGVTYVGVVSTARRRGVLRAMMRHQLHDLHERRAEAVAALWASEASIYGRFGYGVAAQRLKVSVPRVPALQRAPAPDPTLRLRLADPRDVDLVAPVYEAERATRPGMPALDAAGHRHRALDLPGRRNGASELRCVVAEDDERVRGYAYFAVKESWNDFQPAGTVGVRALHALDPAARAALWSYLLDIDLAARTEAGMLPVDDPLLHWLPNPRAAQPRLVDTLHVRLVDVDRALVARRYAATVDLVVGVRDVLCPWNDRGWRLRGGPEGATCEPTTDAPDVVLDVRELGAAYLGGTTLVSLADAGLVEERRPGAVETLSRALRSPRAPWSPFVF